MAFSYIPAETKALIATYFDNIHETWAKEITVYRTPEVTAVASSATYNSFYKRTLTGSDGVTAYTPVSQTIKARIKFFAQEQEIVTGADAQQRIIVPAGSVKIKVNKADEGLLKEAKRIQYDGRNFEVISPTRPVGFFADQFAVFILKPIDE